MRRNPYLNRSMIRAVGEFYGRRRELQRIMSRIGASTPQSVSLVGERRMGKSSLLWHLSQPEIYTNYLEDPDQYIFLSLDFQGQQHLDQAGFCRAFGDHLVRAAGKRLDVPSLTDLSDLERLAQTLDRENLHLVCLFDEFETVTRNAEFSTEFFGALRSLANVYNLAYVTSSRRNLQSLCHTEEISESPFFNIFAEIHVGPMEDADVDELITAPSAAAGLPLAPHAEALRSLGGHLPFFTQIACSAAFEWLSESADDDLNQRHLETAFMEEASSHFHYLLETFEPDELEVIRCVAATPEPPAVGDQTVRRLEVSGYLSRHDGKITLFSTAFARFVREHCEAPALTTTDGVVPSPSPGVSFETKLLRAPLVYVWPLIGVLGIGLASLQIGDDDGDAALETPRPPDAEIAAVSEMAAKGLHDFGLKVDFYFRGAGEGSGTDGVLKVSPSSPASRFEGALGPQDSYRIKLAVAQDCFLYAYRVDASGTVYSLTGGASSKPLEMRAGRIALLPPGADQWSKLDDAEGSLEILLLTSAENDQELRKRFQRYSRATGDRRLSLGNELVAHAAERAVVRITVPLTMGG